MPVNTISANQVSYVDGRRHVTTQSASSSGSRRRDHGQASRDLYGPHGYRCRAKQLQPRLHLVSPGSPVAFDCEGQQTPNEVALHGRGIFMKALGRISIVNEAGQVIYDTFVCYPEEVATTRSPPWVPSVGVYDGDVKAENYAQPLAEVLENVRAIFNKAGIVVGHAVDNEIAYTRGISSPAVDPDIPGIDYSQYEMRDTQPFSEYAALANGKNKIGLKTLTSQILGKTIQVRAHSSVEDARATMELYQRRKTEIDAEQFDLAFRAFPDCRCYHRSTTQNDSTSVEDISDPTSDSTSSTSSHGGAVHPAAKSTQSSPPTTTSSPNTQTGPGKGVTSIAYRVVAAHASDRQVTVTVAKKTRCMRWIAPGHRVALPDIPSLRKDRTWDRRRSIYL